MYHDIVTECAREERACEKVSARSAGESQCARGAAQEGRLRGGAHSCTHRYLSAVISPTSVGIAPVIMLLFKYLRAATKASASEIAGEAARALGSERACMPVNQSQCARGTAQHKRGAHEAWRQTTLACGESIPLRVGIDFVER